MPEACTSFPPLTVLLLVVLTLFPLGQKQSLCLTLNSEGLALLALRERVVKDPFGALASWNGEGIDPCSWFGVECSHGNVVRLNLKDLYLEGTLAPEIGKLAHIKSIILRNNSFFGEIPKEILHLEKLEVLDFGYNNFTGPLPFDLGSIPSLTTLLLDNNDYIGNLSPERYKLKMISELDVNEEQLTGATTREAFVGRCNLCHIGQDGDRAYRRQLLKVTNAANTLRIQRDDNQEILKQSPSRFPSSLSPNSEPFSPTQFSSSESPSNLPSTSASVSYSPSPSHSSIFFTPSPSSIVLPSPDITPPANPPTIVSTPPQFNWASAPSPSPFSNEGNTKRFNLMHHSVIIWSTVGCFSLLILVLAITLTCFQSRKVVTVKPWSTGLSGQLQKAFVTGVPNLKRAELEVACEYFSNIIGSLPDGTMYKGTLSSGVEIAVASVTTSQNWSKCMEAQFRKKIATLSRVNHKNFVNLIGYCEENKPFTRMMVFEYASNGTLCEHLHLREAEELDWRMRMRMRIAMGIAYCLEHMHELKPPIVHKNLQSSSIYLTEDYAAKISDLSFWNDIVAIRKGPATAQLLETPSAHIEDNVYSFGIILFELVTGKIPHAIDNGLLADWAAEYVWRGKPLRDVVDPGLNCLQEEEIEEWSEMIRNCVHPDPEKRPTMKEVTARLKEITAMGPDGANPKSSPLWWAEMAITSIDSS
ncbi:probable inactive receptor-like protein kinase At3g56050 [Abrus precatorius]|uniref:Probable inactive receptor-like protein kinase At3g56050 n=1 Tax=Abrus precatorius TaxID=3816 RepID=A0A8B8MKL8_ABRPR|nr:probable inactive receptor-like protein kinase At3g56050 [Abrus precatorius]